MYRLIKPLQLDLNLKSDDSVFKSLGSLLKIIAPWPVSKGFLSSFSSDLPKDNIRVIHTCTFSMCNSFKIILKGF